MFCLFLCSLSAPVNTQHTHTHTHTGGHVHKICVTVQCGARCSLERGCVDDVLTGTYVVRRRQVEKWHCAALAAARQSARVCVLCVTCRNEKHVCVPSLV